MPQARPYQKPLGDENWSSAMMVNSFGHVCGGQRMLRGEQLFRSNKVHSLTTTAHDGVVCQGQCVLPGLPLRCCWGCLFNVAFALNLCPTTRSRYAGAVLRKQDAWTQLRAPEAIRPQRASAGRQGRGAGRSADQVARLPSDPATHVHARGLRNLQL